MSVYGLYSMAVSGLRIKLRGNPVGRKILDYRLKLRFESGPERRRRERYCEFGPSVAKSACDALRECGIDCWLFAGSLLGAVRDGRFISWDDDLDLCVVIDESFSWNAAESALRTAGFKKVREYGFEGIITEQAYSADGFSFDVFGMIPAGDGRSAYATYYPRFGDRSYSSPSERSVMFIMLPEPRGTSWAEVSGIRLPLPSNAEALLAVHYGADWRIPDPDFPNGSNFAVLERIEGWVANYH